MLEHLVAYEYGTGTAWGYVIAPSQAAIAAHLPEVDVYEEPPSWMTEQDLARIRTHATVELGAVHCLDRILRGHLAVAVAAI